MSDLKYKEDKLTNKTPGQTNARNRNGKNTNQNTDATHLAYAPSSRIIRRERHSLAKGTNTAHAGSTQAPLPHSHAYKLTTANDNT